MEQRGDRERRRPRRVLPALLLLLVMGLGALVSGPVGTPSPSLQTASTTDPVPPKNVRATGADKALVISWDPVNETGLTGYKVYFAGTLKATVTGTATTTTVGGLVNGQQYDAITVRTTTQLVIAYEGVDSAPASGTPHDGLPPAAPAAFAATPGDRQVVLSWNTATDPEVRGYELRRDGTLIATPSQSATSYTDTGRTNGVTSSYTLVAVDVAGMKSTASTATATPRDGVAPAAPTGLVAAPGDGSVALAWTANAEYDVTAYRVLRDGAVIATVGGTSYTDTGLTNGTAYAYALEAVDTSGNVSPVSSPPVPATPNDGQPPATPAGFTATAGDSSVVLSWTASADPEVRSYELRRDGDLIATPSSSATTYTDAGRANGVPHTYTLVAVDVAGMRSSPASASATPSDEVAPAAPTGLMAMPGDQRVALSWTPNTEPDIAAYLVYRDGVAIATVDGLSYVDTAVTNGVKHEYRIAARDTSGNWSPLSAEAVYATAHDGLPPAAPADLTTAPSDRQVVLSWTASTDPEVRGYELRRDGVLVASLAPGATGWTDTGLVNGVSYSYDLVAVDVAAEVSVPASVSATPRDGIAPAAPTGLVAVAGDHEVALSWNDAGEYDIAYHRVLRDGVQVAVVVGTTWTDTGVTNGTTYTYAVVAIDTSANDSELSHPASARPRDAVPPMAPTGLVATPGDRQVVLTWDPNPEADIASYRVWRDGVQIAVVTDPTFTDSGLINGRAYQYALMAVDTSGNDSSPSDPVSATPRDADRPAAPTGLAAVPADGEVALTWEAVPEYDVDGYLVFQDGVQVHSTTGTTWRAGGLENGREYTFTVVAVDTSGNDSEPSEPVQSSPRDGVAPAAPTGVVATPGDTEVVLRWDPNAEADLAGYQVLRDGVEVRFETGTTWTDTGVVNGTRYTYVLVAVDTSGNDSGPSEPAEATPRDGVAPAAPTGVVATPGDTEVVLSWDPNVEADIAGYRVLRDGVEVRVETGTTWTDTDVVNGTEYTYTVVAVDTSGNDSNPSDPVAGTPERPGPAAPTGVTASAGDARATVRWTASPEADVVAYRVLFEDGTVALEVAAPSTAATVTGLENGTTYRFTVVAVDADGDVSVPSDPVEVTPVAAPAAVPVEGAGQSGGVAVSSDGRHLVIGTRARLEASDTNTAYELYLVDRDAGTSRRIAPLPAWATGTADPTNTSAPAISDDGRYLVLATTAKLHPADTNTLLDVYRFDTVSGTWSLVSVPASGAAHRTVAGTLVQTGTSVHSKSPAVAVSADGRVVLFYSLRADLVPGDTNGKVDLFAKDMTTLAVTRVSTTATGASMPRVPTGPALALTPDGRFALFPAVSSTGPAVLYRKTLTGVDAGTLTAVSTVPVSGRAIEFGVFRDAGDIAISDDGRYVAFVTSAKLGTTTPTANWTTGLAYRKDLDSGVIVALGTGQKTVWEHKVELDPTGRYAYYSTAAAALAGDTNGHTDFHRRDLDGGAPGPLVLVTGDSSGRHTTGPTGPVAATEYGRVFALSGDQVLVTTSQALAPVDANRLRDLYAKDLADQAVRTPLG